jgi:hypothetical protein
MFRVKKLNDKKDRIIKLKIRKSLKLREEVNLGATKVASYQNVNMFISPRINMFNYG